MGSSAHTRVRAACSEVGGDLCALARAEQNGPEWGCSRVTRIHPAANKIGVSHRRLIFTLKKDLHDGPSAVKLLITAGGLHWARDIKCAENASGKERAEQSLRPLTVLFQEDSTRWHKASRSATEHALSLDRSKLGKKWLRTAKDCNTPPLHLPTAHALIPEQLFRRQKKIICKNICIPYIRWLYLGAI